LEHENNNISEKNNQIIKIIIQMNILAEKESKIQYLEQQSVLLQSYNEEAKLRITQLSSEVTKLSEQSETFANSRESLKNELSAEIQAKDKLIQLFQVLTTSLN
jgi:hypothetical protein